jgi:hypothetical protein
MRIQSQRRWLAVAATIALVVICGCGKPPQLGSSTEGLKASDALWTAIGTRNPALLKACKENIAKLSASGDLTPEVTDHLQGIVSQAEGGDWDGARTDLRTFIKGQRRGK